MSLSMSSDASGSDRESTKSRLLRELARGATRLGSATGSRHEPEVDVTSTSFNPSEEAETSTRKLDEPSRRLPELRNSAKKYKYPRNPIPESDISLSQLGLAFPDFTQGAPSSVGSASIEIGRGAPAPKDGDAHDFSSSGFNGSFGAADSVRNPTMSTIHNGSPVATPVQRQKSKVYRTTVNGETKFSAEFGDMPNLSELVSGIFENGTPIFSRLAPRAKPTTNHAAVKSLPVPDDEQAIYVSLRLMQERVGQLETSRAEDAAAIETLRARNEVLVREKEDFQRSRRSDSAYASSSGSDGAEDNNIGLRRTKIEKLRLEANVRDLQEQLEKAENRYSASVSTIKSISEERDSITSQLGVAYVTIQSLRKEISTLTAENDELRSRVEHMADEQAARPDSRQLRDRVNELATENETLRSRVENLTVQSAAQPPTQRQHEEIDALVSENRKLKSRVQHTMAESTTDHVSLRRLQKHMNALSAENEELRARIEDFAPEPTTDLNAFAARQEEDFDASAVSRSATTKEKTVRSSQGRASEKRHVRANSHPVEAQHEPHHGKDFMSASNKNANLFPEIRQALERGDVELRPSQARASGAAHAAPATEEYTKHTSKSNVTSEISLLEQRSRSRGIPMEDLTSAFILPDITMGKPPTAAQTNEGATSKPFEKLIDHHLEECGICRRLLEPGKPHSHRKVTKTIQKPVPVSERVPSPTPSNEDPTMRPAQSPGLALASVIKDLEDECKHLKIMLRKLEDNSHQHVPALSKTKRVRLEAKIARVRVEISSKSDQIYALYDVLEGQKEAGQEMSQLEVEITLLDLGIDASRLDLGNDQSEGRLRGGQSSGYDDDAAASHNENTAGSDRDVAQRIPLKSALKRPTSKHAWDELSDANSLPWEGFESTVDEDHTTSTRRGSHFRGRF